jgi:hypothetical protein
VIGKLPWVVLIVVLVGFAVGQWLKTNRPERYAHLGREGLEQGLEPRDDLDEPRDPVAAAAPAGRSTGGLRR